MWRIVLSRQMLKSIIFIHWESLLLYFWQSGLFFHVVLLLPLVYVDEVSSPLSAALTVTVCDQQDVSKNHAYRGLLVLVQLDLAFAHRWLATRKYAPGICWPWILGPSTKAHGVDLNPIQSLKLCSISSACWNKSSQLRSREAPPNSIDLDLPECEHKCYCCKPLSLGLICYVNCAVATRFVTGAQQHPL